MGYRKTSFNKQKSDQQGQGSSKKRGNKSEAYSRKGKNRKSWR